jgi:CubicO group peptidase (beta-lactamase class C family)
LAAVNRRDFSLAALAMGASATAASAEPATAVAPPPAPLTNPHEALLQLLADSKAAALAGMVLTRDGGVIWNEAAGCRRADQPTPVTGEDLWHLGSNTKAMTAALYARLVEQGKAKWGATVPELFPDLKTHPAWAATTIEQLMSHRAGLSDPALLSTAWLISARTDPRPLRDQRRALAAKAFGAPPMGKPGTYEYANTDFIVVGAAIERIADAPWEDVIRAELFEPLEITTAGFGAPQGDQPWGHYRDGTPLDPTGPSDNPAALGPAGTAHMSLQDYAKFLRLFMTDGAGVLSPDSIRRLTTPPTAEDRDYALGWGTFRSRPWAKGPVLFHEGSNTFWRIVTLVAPARGIAVVTATNDDARGAKAAQSLALKLVQQYAPV